MLITIIMHPIFSGGPKQLVLPKHCSMNDLMAEKIRRSLALFMNDMMAAER